MAPKPHADPKQSSKVEVYKCQHLEFENTQHRENMGSTIKVINIGSCMYAHTAAWKQSTGLQCMHLQCMQCCDLGAVANIPAHQANGIISIRQCRKQVWNDSDARDLSKRCWAYQKGSTMPHHFVEPCVPSTCKYIQPTNHRTFFFAMSIRRVLNPLHTCYYTQDKRIKTKQTDGRG